MGMERVGQRFLFVESHPGGIKGEAVSTGVHEVPLGLDTVDTTMGAVVEKEFRVLVEGSEYGSLSSGLLQYRIIAHE